ncbi:MAG: helix-turn-helix transcriptional regulator [Treponema sp.]|jgi:DNA-binding transcriptional regulator YiaG|nr:helix-turn-helix transcriptional regulator [Treponema sp.]
MTHKFSELEEKMSPESRTRVDKAVQEALKELPLDELRNARGLSQKMLAEALGIQQPLLPKCPNIEGFSCIPVLLSI